MAETMALEAEVFRYCNAWKAVYPVPWIEEEIARLEASVKQGPDAMESEVERFHSLYAPRLPWVETQIARFKAAIEKDRSK